MSSGKQERKQELINEICRLVGIGPYKLGIGSSETTELLIVLARKLQVEVGEARGKPGVARSIVELLALNCTTDCDSSLTKSDGGIGPSRKFNQA